MTFTADGDVAMAQAGDDNCIKEPVKTATTCGQGAADAPDGAEVTATRCSFDSKELRWVPQQGCPLVRVRLFETSAGSWRVAVDDKEVALSQVRSLSLPAPGFLVMNIGSDGGDLGLQSADVEAVQHFNDQLSKRKSNYERFEQYEQGSVQSYFQYYAKLVNQQNMLQDHVRTSIYRRAIVENPDDFMGKTAMDIGAGSGILSFFAAQAGAEKVYAVEASAMAEVVKTLASNNTKCFPTTSFEVLHKPLELIKDEEVPGKVDVLISEPIGTFLFNERMIESYLCARDRFLKPGGKMFPNAGNLCIAPYSDMVLHWETQNKNSFWKNDNFYGLDLNAVAERCSQEHFRQPVVDYINPESLASQAVVTRFDFETISIEALQNIELPFDFEIHQPCLIHGIAGWFDALFEGTNTPITLSTAPWCPGTHWYQIRFQLETPLAVNTGQHVVGVLKMDANNVQSYNVSLSMKIAGTEIASSAPKIDLKDPEYRFYTSQNAYCPPGTVGAFGQQQVQQQGAAPVGQPPVGNSFAAQQAGGAAAVQQAQQAQQAAQQAQQAATAASAGSPTVA